MFLKILFRIRDPFLHESNELDYKTFYPKLSDKEAYSALKASLLQENQNYETIQADDISRITKGGQEQRPNIIVITIESFSADFLKEFGNKDHLTPNYDELTTQSIFLHKSLCHRNKNRERNGSPYALRAANSRKQYRKKT